MEHKTYHRWVCIGDGISKFCWQFHFQLAMTKFFGKNAHIRQRDMHRWKLNFLLRPIFHLVLISNCPSTKTLCWCKLRIIKWRSIKVTYFLTSFGTFLSGKCSHTLLYSARPPSLYDHGDRCSTSSLPALSLSLPFLYLFIYVHVRVYFLLGFLGLMIWIWVECVSKMKPLFRKVVYSNENGVLTRWKSRMCYQFDLDGSRLDGFLFHLYVSSQSSVLCPKPSLMSQSIGIGYMNPFFNLSSVKGHLFA